ncbi:MAG: right-handed parallel beta-helix repeat-containing protein [Planctomycetes bacterium]|nr:right-handed parallel beta-helix repeat-containing protein [Planctomycetota bacterium]
MNHRCLCIIALLVFSALAVHNVANPAVAQEKRLRVTFFVSPVGNDGWSGKTSNPNVAGTDGPLATIGRARDAIRELKRRDGELTNGVDVVIRGGTYRLDEPLVFTPEDSGTEQYRITYDAAPGEQPRISAGRPISGWKQQPDGTWTTQIDDVKAGDWYFRQLFVAASPEEPLQRRYRPTIGAKVIAGLTDAPTFDTTMRHRQSQKEFRFHPGDIQRWHGLPDVEIVALHDWSASRLRIAELDLDEQIVRFTGFPVYRIGHWYKDGKNPYFVENVREAMTKPGLWYLDRATGVLAYRPRDGERIEQFVAIAPRAEQLIRIVGDSKNDRPVENLAFRGLTFEHTAWQLPEKGYSSGQGMVDLPAAMDLSGARNCRIERCTFSQLGAYALRLGRGCHDNTVVGNRMFDLGGGGVMVGSSARGNSDTPSGNRIANNLISDGGLVHFSAHGIWLGIAAKTLVSHNVVRRFPYSNVSVGWSWNDKPTACRENVVEFNHIHDAMMLLADGGGIYTLGFQPGTELRGNLIHDVHRSRFVGRAPNNGIFFDQGSKGFLVEDNVIYATADQILRYNQCAADWHTFGENSLGKRPGEEGFPTEAASRAGLEAEYRELEADFPEVPPSPIFSMEIDEP